jgi:hypothetical protein
MGTSTNHSTSVPRAGNQIPVSQAAVTVRRANAWPNTRGWWNTIMRITSINRKESNEYNLELNTEPKLEQAVFDHFQQQSAREPRLKTIAFSKSENSGLILHTGALIDSIHSDGVASLIEDLLNKAESTVARDFSATNQEAKLMDDQKNAIIEAAAKKLGIPIN